MHTTSRRGSARLLAGLLALSAATAVAAQERTIETDRGPVAVETVADGLVHPWAIAFLPDGGGALVTERPGRLVHLSPDGTVSTPIAGVPEVDARDQGGLLDVALDPDFANNRLVYLSYARPADEGTSTAVARGRLSEDLGRLEDVETIFVQEPIVPETRHYGSRLVFDDAGHLFVTLGERFTKRYRDLAQDPGTHLGKVVRIRPDGRVPADNPFMDTRGAAEAVYSIGHRNPQAAAIDPATGRLVVIEHGPRGGDEVNPIEPGVNYGWPVVSHGVNYDGTPVGTGKETMPGYREPALTWSPVIAPSGMTFYDGDLFPEWQGDILVGGLVARAIVRVSLEDGEATEEERILGELDRRIRDVATGPDGAVWVVTDHENGEILRLTPAG